MTIKDDEEAKRQFLLFAGIRLVGLAMFLGGIFIAFTDLLAQGGMPLLGGLLAVAGAVDAVLAPKILKKAIGRR